MNMVGHHHPGMNQKTFLFYAERQAFYHYIGKNGPGKNINPLYHSTTQKINALRVSDLVTCLCRECKVRKFCVFSGLFFTGMKSLKLINNPESGDSG